VTSGSAARTAARRLAHALEIPGWLWFRARHRGYQFAGQYAGLSEISNPAAIGQILDEQERYLRDIITAREGLRFLEIGIGPAPNVERHRVLAGAKGSYTGADFSSVCRTHVQALTREGIPLDAIEFAGNSTGTYAWTLFDMLRSRRRFDVIYLDGHHTFYVDLPAMALADRLLEPGGMFIVDDVRWSLAAFRTSQVANFPAWRFYRGVYKWSDFTSEQQELPHIGLLAEHILVAGSGYGFDESHSTRYWWSLKKPPHRLAARVPDHLGLTR
jgi:SAM-dependent methyltransferase